MVYVSRQLGHASPNITLRTYAHLYGTHTSTAKPDHAATARAALDASYATITGTDG